MAAGVRPPLLPPSRSGGEARRPHRRRPSFPLRLLSSRARRPLAVEARRGAAGEPRARGAEVARTRATSGSRSGGGVRSAHRRTRSTSTRCLGATAPAPPSPRPRPSSSSRYRRQPLLEEEPLRLPLPRIRPAGHATRRLRSSPARALLLRREKGWPLAPADGGGPASEGGR